MTANQKPRILAIGSDRALELAHEALSDVAHLEPVQPEHAPRADGADLALADVRFGRSRAVRLLRTLNESSEARGLPIICCAAPQPAAFIDMGRLSRRYGKRLASEVLRRVVATRLAGPQPAALQAGSTPAEVLR